MTRIKRTSSQTCGSAKVARARVPAPSSAILRKHSGRIQTRCRTGTQVYFRYRGGRKRPHIDATVEQQERQTQTGVSNREASVRAGRRDRMDEANVARMTARPCCWRGKSALRAEQCEGSGARELLPLAAHLPTQTRALGPAPPQRSHGVGINSNGSTRGG
jgi:hypothetical protein